ncbi:MAG: hypothetical protein QXU82_00540 [Candidatus Aenigmatarchaeota archaeon]
MARQFKQRRTKSTRMLFSANTIPSDIKIEEIMEIVFGTSINGVNKAAEASKVIFQYFKDSGTHMISDRELSKIANAASFSRGQFYNVVHDMISMGILRRSEFGDYELSTDFSSALTRIAESYRNTVKGLVKK